MKSVSTKPFHALASVLREGGFATHGDRLENILDGVWTTSTELIAELGQAVVTVQKECKPPSPAQKVLVKECLQEVRKALPGFAYFRWLPFFR